MITPQFRCHKCNYEFSIKLSNLRNSRMKCLKCDGPLDWYNHDDWKEEYIQYLEKKYVKPK